MRTNYSFIIYDLPPYSLIESTYDKLLNAKKGIAQMAVE